MGEPAKKGLTLKQRRFVEEYATSGVATAAYFRAFGRTNTKGKRRNYNAATKSAQRLLQNPVICDEVRAAQAAWQDRTGVTRERVLSELAAVAFFDPDEVYDEDAENDGLPKPRKWGDIPTAARKAIQSVKVKRRRLTSDRDETAWEIEEVEFRFHSKLDAIDKLCKKLGLYEGDTAEGDAGKKVPVELVTRFLAALGARGAQPGGGGGDRGGDAVAPERGAAEPRVPQ